MKNAIILFAIALSVSSCAVKSELKVGEYYKRVKDTRYSIILMKDSTFEYQIDRPSGTAKCKGRWSLLGESLLLKCNEEPIASKLSRGYMQERKMNLIVRNGKLKMKRIILKLNEQQK
jgi:hypothetical protein